MNISEPVGLPDDEPSRLDPTAQLRLTAAGAAALAQARRLYRDEVAQESQRSSRPQPRAPFQRRPD